MNRDAWHIFCISKAGADRINLALFLEPALLIYLERCLICEALNKRMQFLYLFHSDFLQ